MNLWNIGMDKIKNSLDLYHRLHSNIKVGDIIAFSDNPSIISRLIAWKTNSIYTHVGMVIGKTSRTGDRLILLESVEFGPDPIYLSKRVETYKGKVWHFPIKATEEQRYNIDKIAWDILFQDIKYDYKSIAKQVLRKASRDMAELFCSEMCQFIFDNDSVKLLKKVNKAYNPKELLSLNIYSMISLLGGVL